MKSDTLPTFIIAGAPKCGTTALWNLLDEHPQVFMARNKEPHFFTRMQEEIAPGIRKPGPRRSVTFSQGLDWYAGLFAPGGSAAARGEASTHYFSASDSAGLIGRFLPHVRLIFLLRDPVERLYSHYWQDFKSGWDYPGFEAMVAADHPAFRYYAYVSGYRRHLERFFTLFSPERIRVFLHGDLKNRPLAVFGEVCRFIGVDPEFQPEGTGVHHNPYRIPRSRKLEKWLTLLGHSGPVRRMPEGLRAGLGRIRWAVSRANAVISPYPPMGREMRRMLVGRFTEDIRYLENLLGVNLETWRRV